MHFVLSLELNSSTSKIHTASVTIDCIELVEGDQTSSRIKRKVGVVDTLNQDIVVKEFETGKPKVRILTMNFSMDCKVPSSAEIITPICQSRIRRSV
ncbi:hypothetical protein A4A49_04173 [Nicotiana attenuata]|uniref:Uncharacterized protein n=1 Tax=Nicotiana attenuata TaxID=49451 RepID=A0A314KXE1_NICAT|nr:hypothetical protein A4A49_04173 [Nicotiana attenuata]